MGEQTNVPTGTENTPDNGGERTFTQAQVDAIVGERLARARRDMPDEAELARFRAWRQDQDENSARLADVTRERDEARTALAASNERLSQYDRERYLTGKLGVAPEDADYYAFKIGKLVSKDKPFEQAAEEYLKGHRPRAGAAGVRVDTAGSLGGGGSPRTGNEQMNALIRGARK